MTRGDSVGNQRTTAPWSHKCWAVPKNDHPRWYGTWLLILGQDSQFLKFQEKKTCSFFIYFWERLEAGTMELLCLESWIWSCPRAFLHDTTLWSDTDLWSANWSFSKIPPTTGILHIINQLRKKRAIEKCLENEIYLESIQKSLGIYSTFITLEPFNPQFWQNISCLLRW